MKESPPYEANSHSARQGIPRFIWNPKVYWRVHKNNPLIPIVSQLSPDRAITP